MRKVKTYQLNPLGAAVDMDEVTSQANKEKSKGNLNSEDNCFSKRRFLLGPVFVMYVFAFTNNSMLLEQYVYYYMQKTQFPNVSITQGEQTLCDENSTTTNVTSQKHRDQQDIQVATSNFMLYTSLAMEIPSIFADVVIGSFSDKFGRKRLMALPLIASLTKSLACVFGIHFEINVYIFLGFYFIEGCAGGWIAALSVAFAYIADVTEKGKSRSFAIALIEICLGIGFIIGSTASGYMIMSLGFMYSIVVSVCVLSFGIILILCLPETVTNASPAKNNMSRLQACKHVFMFYIRDSSRWKYIICVLIFMFMGFSSLSRQKVETLYLLNSPFCWSSVKLGWYAVLRAAVPQLFSMLMVKPFQYCLDDATIALIGSLSCTAGNILQGFATTNIKIYLVPVVSLLGSLPIPMVRSILSQITSPNMQGAVFSSLAIIETISSLIGSLVGTSVYSATVSVYKGLTFFVFAGNSVIAAILLCVLIVNTRRSSVKKEENIEMKVKI